jgi:hypothetical protein
MKMSKRAYARHRGCSDTAVRKAVLEGRISADADGQIDPAKADKAWPKEATEGANLSANQGANHEPSSQEVRSTENASLVRQVLAEEGQPIPDDTLTLNHVRMAVGILKAHEQRVSNERAAGELLPRGDVLTAMTSAFARVRGKLLAVPTKVAPRMVGLNKANEAEAIIRAAIYEVLTELASTVVVGIPPDDIKRAARAEEGA